MLVLVRLFAYKMGLPITEPELTWLLTGERMANGFSLYKEIWTTLEPFSAMVYYIIHLLFGKSTVVYFVLSLLLVFLQAVIFTNGLRKNKIFKEATMLPALFYVLFSSLYFDFYTLSPVLLGTTFMLWAFDLICFQTRVATTENRFFAIGLLTGIAALFYLPFTLFLIFSLFSLGFYSNTNIRQQMILILAFFFPGILVHIYYFWTDNLGNYYQYGLFPSLHLSIDFTVDFLTLLKIVVLPLLLLLAATFAIAAHSRYIHYQNIVIKIAGFWLFTGLIAFWLEKSIAPHTLILFVPPLSFFVTHLYLISIKSKIVSEVSLWVMFGGILLISFYALKKPDTYTKAHLIRTVPEEFVKRSVNDKKVLVLGNDKRYYINNKLSGPYLNWRLSAWQFEDLTKYAVVSAIYEAIEVNKPAYIVDLEKRMPLLSARIPSLQRDYERLDTTNLYRRKF